PARCAAGARRAATTPSPCPCSSSRGCACHSGPSRGDGGACHLGSVGGKIEHQHSVLGPPAPFPLGMPQRAPYIVVTRLPMLFHREPRELVVLSVRLIGGAAVDEMHNGDGGVAIAPLRQKSRLRVV